METRKRWLPALLALAACGDGGDGEQNVRGTQLVAGAELKVQDVSGDGAQVAYTDAADNLFVVPTAGGAAVLVAENVDDARFEGKFLVIFQGLSADERTAAVMLTLEAGQNTPVQTGTNVVTGSPRASFDGEHLFFAQNQANPTFEDLFLDGTEIFTGAESSRGRFSPLNDVLVLSTQAGNQKLVQAFPVGGGAPSQLGSGTSNRFQIANDGSVIIADNENGDIADLTRIANGNATVLAPQASDNAFRLLDDQDTLAFLSQGGALQVVNLDGSGAASLVAAGVVEIPAATRGGLVYATAFDNDSEVGDFRFVNADGTGDIALGADAIDEGFSSDQAFYLFRDGVIVDLVTQKDEEGSLKALTVANGNIATLGARVEKASLAKAAQVVFLDKDDLLQVADLASGEAEIFEDFVNKFDLVPDAAGSDVSSRVVFSVPGGEEAGVYIDDL
jgi:hypothetical protein